MSYIGERNNIIQERESLSHMNDEEKECPKCGKLKMKEAFYENLQFRDGRMKVCIICHGKKVKESVAKKRLEPVLEVLSMMEEWKVGFSLLEKNERNPVLELDKIIELIKAKFKL